jgi:unsaturated rhamnogalacturonyl hydrolase
MPRRACAVLLASLLIAGTALGAETPAGWDQAGEILSRIHAPTFPARNFPITDYGAVAGADATAAIRRAIEACHAAGGGSVTVPDGVFLTGAIRLLSNVNLHLAGGATLRFSTDPAAYLPVVFTRWESIECMNYSPFIYALDQEDIAVTGTGTLDGSAGANAWWNWCTPPGHGRPPLFAEAERALNRMGDANVPVAQRIFGAGHYLRPNFIQPYRCRNVLIEGVTILNSPMWEINPVLCTNVTVRQVKISSLGPNNDGCDPESCRDVLIERCNFATGDDCIAIKSGRNVDGRRVGVAAENLIVRDCTMQDGHAGVAIGSEVSADCRNVYVEDCVMDSPNLERALRLKSNARRGGTMENIYMRRVEIGRVSEALLTVDFLYEDGPKGTFRPVVRNVQIDHVTVSASPRVFFITGFAGATIDGIRVSNSTITGLTAPDIVEHAGRVELDAVEIVPAQQPHGLSSRPAQWDAAPPPAPAAGPAAPAS